MKCRSLIIVLTVIGVNLAIGAACSTAPPANTNQSSSSTPQPSSNTAQSNSAQGKQAQPSNQNQSSTGTIEVTSVPPGARVLLISNDESGAGEPQTKGLTPATITGVQPGKYTVHLERPGYRFFQREIDVKASSTVKVNATLRKQ